MRILEIGNEPYLKGIRPDEVDYFYVGKKTRHPEPVLTFRAFRELRAKLRRGDYGLVAVSIWGFVGPVWRRDRGVVSNLLKMARALGGNFYTLGFEVVLRLLRGIDVPLVVIDRKDDPEKIPPHFFGLLARCRAYFWRELPVKLEHGFTYTTGYLEDSSSVDKAPVFVENRHKIKPLPLGLPPGFQAEPAQAGVPKDIDVFFAGTLKRSQVRQDGYRLLEEMKAEGWRVELASEAVFSPAEFRAQCARAWLVWSPEGHAWDCFRHDEVGAMGSVPVMNFPRIRRHRPLEHGVHAFFYAPEGDDLKRVIRAALADKDKLREMARAGRDHVLRHHTPEAIFSYVTGDRADSPTKSL